MPVTATTPQMTRQATPDDLAHLGEALLEGGGLRLDAAEHVRDLTHFGVRAGGGGAADRLALGDEGAHVDEVLFGGGGGVGGGGLFHAGGFAAEHRFVAEDAAAPEDAAVGGDAVARLEAEDVLRDHLAGGDAPGLPVAHDDRPGCGELAELFEGAFGAVLLEEAEQGVDKDDRDDGERLGVFPISAETTVAASRIMIMASRNCPAKILSIPAFLPARMRFSRARRAVFRPVGRSVPDSPP